MGEWRSVGEKLTVNNDCIHYRTKPHNWGTMDPEDDFYYIGSQFSLFMVMFYTVTVNTGIANTAPLIPGEIQG